MNVLQNFHFGFNGDVVFVMCIVQMIDSKVNRPVMWMLFFVLDMHVMPIDVRFMIDTTIPVFAFNSFRVLASFPAHPLSTELFEAFHQPIMSQAGSE